MSEGTRTPDRLDHNQELYQLSYAHRALSNVPTGGYLSKLVDQEARDQLARLQLALAGRSSTRRFAHCCCAARCRRPTSSRGSSSPARSRCRTAAWPPARARPARAAPARPRPAGAQRIGCVGPARAAPARAAVVDLRRWPGRSACWASGRRSPAGIGLLSSTLSSAISPPMIVVVDASVRRDADAVDVRPCDVATFLTGRAALDDLRLDLVRASSSGCAWTMSATAPETTPAAIEVPPTLK